MPTTSRATASGPSPEGVPPKVRMTKTRTKVPMISVIRFHWLERIAGPVEKTASLLAGSGSTSKCCLWASQHDHGAEEGAEQFTAEVGQGRGEVDRNAGGVLRLAVDAAGPG